MHKSTQRHKDRFTCMENFQFACRKVNFAASCVGPLDARSVEPLSPQTICKARGRPLHWCLAQDVPIVDTQSQRYVGHWFICVKAKQTDYEIQIHIPNTKTLACIENETTAACQSSDIKTVMFIGTTYISQRKRVLCFMSKHSYYSS